MKTITRSLGLLGLATGLIICAGDLQGQDRPRQGNPGQMRQRMLERLRQQLEVKDDAEWKAISDHVTKVMEARRALGQIGGPGLGPPPGGPPPQDRPPGPGDVREGPGGPGGPGGPPAFNRQPDPEMDALRRAIEGKAPPAELKARLAELRAARQKKEAQLEKARQELRQLLSVRQEAVAVMMGILQ